MLVTLEYVRKKMAEIEMLLFKFLDIANTVEKLH
jgi:hypothetical protein